MADCSIDDCDKPSRKRGWCEMHYTRFKTHGTPHGPARRTQTPGCTADGCTSKPLARDLCRKHYYRQKHFERTGSYPQDRVAQPKPARPPRPRTPQPCAVDDCDIQATGRGWCGKHYQRWRRFGDPTFHPPQVENRCSVDGCDRVSNARNLCGAHYRRWQLYGDPLATLHGSHVALPGEAVCLVEDCDRRVLAKGMCNKHYLRTSKHGDPSIRGLPLAVRICATCGTSFDPGAGKARKYCGRRCRPGGRIGSVNKRSWVEKLGNEDGWSCWLCNEPVDRTLYWPHPDAGSVDHVLPVFHGGTDERANLRLAHLTCNTARGHRQIDQ